MRMRLNQNQAIVTKILKKIVFFSDYTLLARTNTFAVLSTGYVIAQG